MRTLFSVIWLLAIHGSAAADYSGFDWGQQELVIKIDKGRSGIKGGSFLVADDEANLYLSGTFQGTIRLGTNVLTSHRVSDAFLVKYDRDRNLLWRQEITNATAYGAAAFRTDAVFVTGTLYSATKISGVAMGRDNRPTAYLAKFDSHGLLLWVRQVTTDPRCAIDAWAVAVDAAGNSCIVGRFGGEADFDGTKVTPARRHQHGLFLAKYDPEGKIIWAKADGTLSTDPRGLAMDGAGNAYVAGTHCSVGEFDSEPADDPAGEMFLAKYDADGNRLWARSPGGPRVRAGVNVALDRKGDPYVVGFCKGTRTFGPTNLVVIDPTRDTNYFLAKYSANGDFQWVRQYCQGDFDFSNVVSTRASGVELPPSLAGRGHPPEAIVSAADERATLEAVRTAGSEATAQNPRPPTASASPRRPALDLFKQGDYVVLFWSNEFAGFALESSETLLPFPLWEPVVQKVEGVDGRMVVLLPVQSAHRFYRLRRP